MPATARQLLWGIDLGGTKIEGVVIDASAPDRPVARVRVPTESDQGYDHIVGRVRAVAEQLGAATGADRPPVIGIGTPGFTEPASGLLKNSNTVCLNGRRLGHDLSSALGGADTRLANDANCFALAEATLGAARGRGVVFGVILGTGVGGGIAVHGRVLDGVHGIAGEWGHNSMRGETTPCYCGRTGCVETVISGPALERFYETRTGDRRTLETIADRATQGDPAAVATLEHLTTRFGESIAAVINILDPHTIVIGGGVGNIDALYAPPTRAAIERHLFSSTLRTELRRPALGDSAGVFGAALLAGKTSEPGC